MIRCRSEQMCVPELGDYGMMSLCSRLFELLGTCNLFQDDRDGRHEVPTYLLTILIAFVQPELIKSRLDADLIAVAAKPLGNRHGACKFSLGFHFMGLAGARSRLRGIRSSSR